MASFLDKPSQISCRPMTNLSIIEDLKSLVPKVFPKFIANLCVSQYPSSAWSGYSQLLFPNYSLLFLQQITPEVYLQSVGNLKSLILSFQKISYTILTPLGNGPANPLVLLLSSGEDITPYQLKSVRDGITQNHLQAGC